MQVNREQKIMRILDIFDQLGMIEPDAEPAEQNENAAQSPDQEAKDSVF